MVAGLVSDIVIERSIFLPTQIQYGTLRGDFLRNRTNNGIVLVVYYYPLIYDYYTTTN